MAGRDISTLVVKHLKHGESNTHFWNNHFGKKKLDLRRGRPEHVCNVCKNFCSPTYDNEQSGTNFTQFLPWQLTFNSSQFCDKVCWSKATMKIYMSIQLMLRLTTVLLLVTHTAELTRVSLARANTCVPMGAFCRTGKTTFFCEIEAVKIDR